MTTQPYRQRLWLLIAFFFLAISTSVSASITASDLRNVWRSVPYSGKIIDRPEIVSPLLQERAGNPHEAEYTAEDEQDEEHYNHHHDYNDTITTPLLPRQETIPTPFDTSIGTNFTTKSCPKFFTKFLASPSFTTCHPLSMLLRNSYAFFNTLQSSVATSHVLDITCSVDSSQCSNTLSSLASDLLKPENCGHDYNRGNPLVVDAYVNLVAYEPLYHASCLKNPVDGDYCFVDAVTNSTNPANYDVYFLPFGDPLSDNDDVADYDHAVPNCTKCLEASMDVFGRWAARDGQPLVGSYLPSARVVNRRCGVGFANLNVTLGQRTVVNTSGVAEVGRPVWLWTFLGGVLAFLVLGDGF